MSPRPVRVERPADEVLLHCRRASERGQLSEASYRELLAWFDRVCGELATGFEQFGTSVWSWADVFAGRTTRTRTDLVAGSPLTLTATLDKRTQTVWGVSLGRG